MQEEPMVGASTVIRETGIPRTTLYRLIESRHIPVHEERKPWQKRAVKRFRMSEVRDALARMKIAPPPTST
jgi:predicted DNA-binding transcriptional regulator AlpA